MRKINESYGVFNGCKELAIRIADEIFTNWKIDNDFFTPLDIPCWFSADGEAHIYPTKYNLRAAYILDPRMDGRTTILVNPKIVNPLEEGKLIASLMHELTHAYRDAMKRRKGGSENQSAESDGYYKNFNYKFGNDKYSILKNNLSDFIYITSQMEMPAFIAGMYGNLSGTMVEVETAEEALEVIKSTPEYHRFEDAFKFANEFYNCTDENMQYDLVMWANELTTIKFRNFNQFRKWVVYKYNRASNKLMKFIPKMIYKFFEEN